MRPTDMLQALLGLGWTRSNGNESGQSETDGLSIRVLTHNIRYATSSPFKNEKPWKDRFPLIMSQFAYHTRYLDGIRLDDSTVITTASTQNLASSFICMQEVLHTQLQDILGALNHRNGSGSSDELPHGPYWAHIGVAREDGKTKGEYSPILYPAAVFDLLHFENRWLSPTPHKPSKGWDAGSERILTTGVFEHKITKQRVAAFNTHLDNAGSEAREKSVAIILEVIERIRVEWASSPPTGDDHVAHAAKLQFFLAGDFNSFPTQEAYKAVVGSGKMVDAHDAIPKEKRYGNEITFTGFQPDTDEDKDEIGRIDFVWFGPKSEVQGKDGSEPAKAWSIQGYSVLPNVFDDGVFSSDHRCVVADAVLQTGRRA